MTRTCILMFCFLVFAINSSASEIVQLTISEALPSGVNGLERQSGPVTVGVPLPENSGISNINQLGLTGASMGQFRSLAWWPNGNIKWVLVDTQASVEAGGTASVALTTGSGNFGGQNLATDGNIINVSTGVATFTIKKTGWNVFDTVTVGSTSIVNTGNAGRVSAVGADGGTIYSSTNDSSATAVIEENGPAKTTIKCTGSLKSSSGLRLMDYTLRLYFFKGKSYVKGDIILRNASKAYPQAIVFNSAEVVVPVSIGASKIVNFSRNSDVVSRALQSGGSAYVFQGYNSARALSEATNCYTWDPPVPGTCSNNNYTYDTSYTGLLVQSDSETINALGNPTNWTQGYAGIKDSNGSGVNVALRWMSSNFPAGFDLKDNGETSIELFSKHNNKTLKLQFGKHEPREVMWDFHTQDIDGNATLYALQHPLIAKAPFEYYRDNKVLFGQSELVSATEQQSVFSSIGKTAPSLENPPLNGFIRAYFWPTTGGLQSDFQLDYLLDYIRTGNTGFYVLGNNSSLYTTTAIYRSDDFGAESVTVGADPLSSSQGISGGFFDMEHAFVMSLPLYYFLSGNEEVKDSFVDYGENLYLTQLRGYYSIPSTPYLRAWSRKLRNFALAYEFGCQTGSCDSTYKSNIESAINSFLDYRDNPSLERSSPHGRNMDRGYLWWDTTTGSTVRTSHSFFHTQIHFEAIWQLYRIMKATNWDFNRILDVEDYMTGLSQFFLDEFVSAWPESVSNPNGYIYGWNYDYLLDSVNSPPADNTSNGQRLDTYSAARPIAWLYKQGQNKLNIGLDLLWQNAIGIAQRESTELQEQAFMWTHLNQSSIPAWTPLPIAAVDQGSGSYQLSWTVPTGAKQIHIKHSPSASRQVVEWLGFNKDTRSYQYDPASYIAYFAATNTVQPTPATEGTVQTVSVSGLPTGLTSANFAAKYITGTASPIPGSCGPSNGLSLPSAPTVDLCSAGTASAVTGTGPWSWTCAGSGGGSTANCGAALLEGPVGNASAAVACSAIADFR